MSLVRQRIAVAATSVLLVIGSGPLQGLAGDFLLGDCWVEIEAA
jgi:hypothetical protein